MIGTSLTKNPLTTQTLADANRKLLQKRTRKFCHKTKADELHKIGKTSRALPNSTVLSLLLKKNGPTDYRFISNHNSNQSYTQKDFTIFTQSAIQTLSPYFNLQLIASVDIVKMSRSMVTKFLQVI